MEVDHHHHHARDFSHDVLKKIGGREETEKKRLSDVQAKNEPGSGNKVYAKSNFERNYEVD